MPLAYGKSPSLPKGGFPYAIFGVWRKADAAEMTNPPLFQKREGFCNIQNDMDLSSVRPELANLLFL